MSKKERKEYSEESHSRINDLFKTSDDIVKRQICLTTYGQDFTLEKIQSSLIERFPFIKTKMISPSLDLTSISKQDVDLIKTRLDDLIPRLNCPCLVQCIRVKNFKEVVFYDSEIKGGKLFPPRMTVDVGRVQANSSVRVNTGYILKIPNKAEILNMKDGKIIKTEYKKQPQFVIIPQFIFEYDDIIPSIYVRDPDDTGLFTINFTTRSGIVGIIRIVLKAYRVVSPRNQVRLINPEQTDTTVFKGKDQNYARLVINPKPKIVFESMVYDKNKDNLLFKTYDSTQEKIKVFEKQKLMIERLNTLITSRKREWDNENLVTLTGLFVSHCRRNKTGDISYCIPPKLAKGSQYSVNTHCLTFIDVRLVLFSTRIGDDSDVKVINGALCDIPNYKDVSKDMRKIMNSLNGLSVGASNCINIASRNPQLPVDRLLRLMDYHRSILERDNQLKEKCFKSDKELFNSRPLNKEAYSVSLYRSFDRLMSMFLDTNAAAYNPTALIYKSHDLKNTASPLKRGNDTNLIADDQEPSKKIKCNVEVVGNTV